MKSAVSGIVLLLVLLLEGGCTIVDPYIAQPQWSGSYDDALNVVSNAKKQLSDDLSSQNTISAVSGLGTFGGLGGAGLAAVFGGSRDIVLGLAGAGATSFAVSGLYGSKAQAAIYNNGLDAIACIEDATAPMTTAHRKLRALVPIMDGAASSVEARIAELTGRSDLGEQVDEASALVAQARSTDVLVQLRYADEDSKAGGIVSAVRAVVATVNKQLQTVVPDASALARAGSGLGAASLAAQTTAINGATTGRTATAGRPEDPVLRSRVIALQAAVTQVSNVLALPVVAPSISCKVADAPVIAPISVTLPAGATQIEMHPTSDLSYGVVGGTQPYVKIQWIGSVPSTIDVVIESPNNLHISPHKGAKPTDFHDGDIFTFDIYDSLGQHMAQPLQIKIVNK